MDISFIGFWRQLVLLWDTMILCPYGKTKAPCIELIYLYFGLLCEGRSLLTWAGVHRMHHAYAGQKMIHSKNHPWYVILFSLGQ